MITEIRHIIFSNDELKLAMQSTPADGIDARARIVKLEILEGPPPTVRVETEAAGRGAVQVIEAHQLARIMVAYCRSKKIPLPKDALKTLHAQGDQLCFSIMSSLT